MKKQVKHKNHWDEYNQIGPFTLPKVDSVGWVLNEIPRDYQDQARIGGLYVTKSHAKWTIEWTSIDITKLGEVLEEGDIRRYVDNVIYWAKKNELKNKKERIMRMLEKLNKNMEENK
jgi:hypothetical protein